MQIERGRRQIDAGVTGHQRYAIAVAGKPFKQEADAQMAWQDLELLADALVRGFHKEGRSIRNQIGFQPAFKPPSRQLAIGPSVSRNTRRLRFDVLVMAVQDLDVPGRDCPARRGWHAGRHEPKRDSAG
jgi:hypothetical protein